MDLTAARRASMPALRSLALLAWLALTTGPGVAGAIGAETAAPPPRAVELEAVLAATPEPYLVVDGAAAEVQVRARGVVLHRAVLRDSAVVRHESLVGGPSTAAAAEGVWRVTRRPASLRRRLVAPAELRPLPGTEEEAALGAVPAAATEPAVETPATWVAVMDTGWRLEVVAEIARPGPVVRLLAAFADGWRRLAGMEVDSGPRLQLVLDEEDARRLHHLLRTGAAVLVVP